MKANSFVKLCDWRGIWHDGIYYKDEFTDEMKYWSIQKNCFLPSIKAMKKQSLLYFINRDISAIMSEIKEIFHNFKILVFGF